MTDDHRLELLHVSDLHFGPPYHERVGEALMAAAWSLAPDAIVVSGDLTQRAKPEQFAAARAYLDRLPEVPRIVIPGNHDIPLYRIAERFLQPREQFLRHICDELDQVVRVDGMVAVALDSTSPRRTISNGRIHKDQLELCERVFRDVPEDLLKVVVAHHHFVPAPDWERDRPMPKARRALDRFVDLRVDVIFGGHLHRAYIGNSLDVYAGQDPDQGIVIIQCGTSTSRRGRTREREKNSFNHVRVAGDMLYVTHYLYFEERAGFEPVSRHQFPRPGRRFLEVDGSG